MQIEYLKISSIKPYEKNAKKHDKDYILIEIREAE